MTFLLVLYLFSLLIIKQHHSPILASMWWAPLYYYFLFTSLFLIFSPHLTFPPLRTNHSCFPIPSSPNQNQIPKPSLLSIKLISLSAAYHPPPLSISSSNPSWPTPLSSSSLLRLAAPPPLCSAAPPPLCFASSPPPSCAPPLPSSAPLKVGLRLLLYPLGANIVTRTACCTVGIVFPVYSTFKAIEMKDRSEQERWLLYWAAYGSFSLVEMFSDKILSWFPLYYHMKFAFLVWLQLPSGNGARHLYARHLRPFLLRHQDRLDQLHGFVTREITKFIITHQGEIEFLKAVLKRCANTANQMLKEVNQPVQPGGQNMIEGPNGSTRPPIQDSGSDSDSEN